MRLKVSRDKGFTLVELMITVGIIGILSLMALPVYSNYIQKVKLTEVALKHMYLLKQLETEFDAGGAEAVYSYILGACSSKPNFGGVIVVCDTNIGLASGQTVVTYDPVETIHSKAGVITIAIMPVNQLDMDYNIQYFSFSDNSSNNSVLYHFPKSLLNSSSSVANRAGYAFNFVQRRDGVTDGQNIEITDKTGTYFADLNRWHCGGIKLKNTASQTDGPIPKAIRPKMCNLSLVHDYDWEKFIED